MKQLLYLFSIILLLTPVLALQESLSLYPSQSTLNACACEIREQSLLVQNTGEVPNAYQLFKSGTAADWLSISDGGFSLQPGEQRSVQQYLKIPCGISGPYDVSTVVQTQFGIVQQATQQINVRQCADLNVVPLTTYRQQSCPCTPVAFTFQIENNGNAAESYRLKVSPEQYTTITQSSLMLIPGEKRTVTVYVHSPCAIFGHADFALHVVAEHSGLEGIHPFSLDVNACYEYGIGIDVAYDVCQNVVNSIPITITNAAEFRNSYTLDVSGVDWGSVDPVSIPLESKETADAVLTLDPGAALPGVYPITVDAVSERGELMQSKSVALNLAACYEHTLIPESLTPVAIACEDNTFAILVQNTGTKDAELIFGLDGPAFATLDQSSTVLKPGEARMVKELLKVPCDAQPFTTVLTSTFTKLPYLGQQLTADFSTMSMADAYALDIAVSNVRVGYDQQSFAITLTNNGIRDGTYNIGLTGADFVALDQQQVVVPAGQSVAVTLTTTPTAETAEGVYPLSIGAALVNPYGQVVVYQRDITITLSERSMFMRLLPYLGGFLLLALLALLLFWRSSKASHRKPILKQPKERKDKIDFKPIALLEADKIQKSERKHFEFKLKPWLIKLLALLGIILLAGLLTYFTSPLLKEGAAPAPALGMVRIDDTTQSVLPGNVVIINGPTTISVILTNRDAEETYDITITAPEWVTPSVRHTTLTPSDERAVTLDIDPTGQPAGDYKVSFAAEGRGGTTQTEYITLRIVRLALWQRILFWSIAGLLALIILLILLLPKLKRKHKPKVEPIMLERIRAAEIAKFSFRRLKPFFIPEKGAWQRFRERLKRVSWKRWMLLLIPIAIILLLLIVGLTTPLFTRTAAVAKEGYQSMAERIKHIQPAELDLTSDDLPDIIYLNEDGVIIPLKLRNDDPTAKYLISVKEDVDWISTDKQVLDIPPKSVGQVNIAVAPNAGVKEGRYRISIVVTMADSQKLFDKGLVLDYQKAAWKKILLWVLLVLLAGVLLAIVITFLRRREINQLHTKPSDVQV